MRAPLHILVVDDDPAVATAARALLALRGCHIDTVFSGLDALARVRAGGIDAILLDVWMPEVDGLSALEEIARLPAPPRVVLMSGHIDAKVEEAVANGRAMACLPKPIDFDLAFTLLSGDFPARPLTVKPDLDRAALGSIAALALVRGTVFLEGAPQLPPGTPVSLQLPTSKEAPLTLLAVSDPAARAAGRRGLGLRLAELTDLQRQALRACGVPKAAELPSAPNADAPPSRAAELYRRGLERLETGKYDKALLDLKRALDLAPGDALIAAAALRAEELAGVDKARSLFKEAEEAAEKDLDAALRLVEDAIHLDPSRALYHREAARLYLQKGNALERAEECLAAAVHLAPSDPAPRLHLAQLFERAGRSQEALWACEAALQLFPGDHELKKLSARLKKKLPATEA